MDKSQNKRKDELKPENQKTICNTQNMGRSQLQTVYNNFLHKQSTESKKYQK